MDSLLAIAPTPEASELAKSDTNCMAPQHSHFVCADIEDDKISQVNQHMYSATLFLHKEHLDYVIGAQSKPGTFASVAEPTTLLLQALRSSLAP